MRAQASIVLADDHVVLREGLARILEQTGRYAVVAAVSSSVEMVRLAGELEPDLALMGIEMPGTSGIDAVRELNEASARTRVLVFSVHEDQRSVEAAMRSGAAGYVPKTAELSELIQAIDIVISGRTYISPGVAHHLVSALESREQSRLSMLTPREQEVLKRVGGGDSTKEIAAVLGVSPRTVDTHRANIMQKLGVHRAPELVRLAIREGLISP